MEGSFLRFLRTVRRKLIPNRLWAKIRPLKYLGKIEFVIGPLTYNQDGLATKHNCDFIQDERFAIAYQKGEATGSWGGAKIHWRAFVACWAAEKGIGLAGDFVECGVNRGGLARTIIEFVNFSAYPQRHFYLLDTFEGLVDEYISPEERDLGFREGMYPPCLEDVRKTFSGFENVHLIPGTVPDTLDMVRSDQIAFLSIDMNCVAPEIAAAEHFWERLVSGAVMLLDDYGWPGHINQKLAFDEFAAEHNVRVLALPTGQGLIIKP